MDTLLFKIYLESAHAPSADKLNRSMHATTIKIQIVQDRPRKPSSLPLDGVFVVDFVDALVVVEDGVEALVVVEGVEAAPVVVEEDGVGVVALGREHVNACSCSAFHNGASS